jgi:Transcriptional regulator, AbiEi antitoxin
VTDALPGLVLDTLQEQNGVLSRAQALSAGMSRKQIESRLRGGRWQRLYPGVYATFSGDPGRAALLWAAVLRAGNQHAGAKSAGDQGAGDQGAGDQRAGDQRAGDQRAGGTAVLSHVTAAELAGLIGAPSATIHVTVPSGRGVTPIPGVVLHYSQRVAQARHPVRTPPQTRIEETVLDLAVGAARLDEALGWIFRACGSRKTTPDRLAAALALRSRARWRAELGAALGLGAQGVHSLLEFRYVNRVERPHGLPAATRQYRVIRAGQRQYQDVTYQAYGVVVELDGRVAHPAELRWRDIRRDNGSAAAGQVTLRYGWPDVTQRPCLVAAEVGAVLSGRGWAGRLRRCGPACLLPP